jgi:D-proline reductase (dithiol) PrdB
MTSFEVDAWRFTGSFLSRALGGQIPDEPTHDPIPWTPLEKPLSECRVSLLSTAGISLKSDAPFDMEMERRNPMRGDPSWRALPADATSADIASNHLHIDTGYIERDLDVALPVDRLRELAGRGEVGSIAHTHYSIMGYQGNDASRLTDESAPAIAASMREDAVDVAILAPV